MLKRYTRDDSGKTITQALIYTADEHKILPKEIDPEAIKIARRLRASGHHAYIVGGAVRDLMLGRRPKDFDIATDAQPNRIRRLFRNSRVIGKRFRLVHIFFGDNIIEVSTFRSENADHFQNEYGEIEEDVMRRDFTVNALYYDPVAERVVDYVGGVEDVRQRRLRPVIPIERIFVDDPVRMIRAIKYSVGGDLKMTGKLRRLIRKQADLLAEISPSRITEEVFKILLSGRSSRVFAECMDYGLLRHMIPNASRRAEADAKYRKALLNRLGDLDLEITAGNESRRSRAIAYLSADYLFAHTSSGAARRIVFAEAFADIKRFIHPLVPANKDVEMGLVYLIRRRKNYERSGSLETTPPSERPYDSTSEPPLAPRAKKRPGNRRPSGRHSSERRPSGHRSSGPSPRNSASADGRASAKASPRN